MLRGNDALQPPSSPANCPGTRLPDEPEKTPIEFVTERFNEDPTLNELEILDYDDGKPFEALSFDRRKLKIFNTIARQLAELDGATEAGHVTDEGYYLSPVTAPECKKGPQVPWNSLKSFGEHYPHT